MEITHEEGVEIHFFVWEGTPVFLLVEVDRKDSLLLVLLCDEVGKETGEQTGTLNYVCTCFQLGSAIHE
jgi:hypothetical protein